MTPQIRRAIPAARVLALMLVVYVVWAAVFDKWTWAAMHRPIAYVIDGMFTLAEVKAGSEFAWLPFASKEIPNLGAPYVANWNDFPASDDHVFFLLGLLARVVGVVAAANFGFLFAAMGAALSLYAVARWLRIRWEAAFVGAALFGLSPFLFYRSLHHFTLTDYWHVPLMIPLAMWVARRRAFSWRSKRFRWAAGFAVLAAIHNVYYFNYALQLVALGILAQLLRRAWQRALMGAALVGVSIVAFGLVNLDTFRNTAKLGPNPVAVHRAAQDVEIYALRPLELFHPGARHRVEAFAAAADRHKASTIAIGEFPSMYLGIVGGVGFLWLMVVTLRSVFLGKRVGWGRFGVWAVWLIFVSIDGGVMQTLQIITGQNLFRSNNRVSVFLLAFALLFVARLLSLIKRRVVLIPVAAVLIALGAYDQTPTARIDPNFPHWENVATRERIAAADERLVAAAEQRLAPGTAVYQLPAMTYPEAGPLGRVPDYDQFRPYLYSTHLRFSYGNMKGRPEAAWQHQVAGMTDDARLAELQTRGFGAIYVLRNAYGPQQVQALLGWLASKGHTEVIESEYGDSFFVILRPPNG